MFYYPAQTITKITSAYSGAILWYSLPCNLREAEFLEQFKRLLAKEPLGTAFVESSFFIVLVLCIFKADECFTVEK